MTLKNRIQYSPIVTNHAGLTTGEVTPQLLEFVSAQAKTGASLVTIGSTPVNFKEGRDFFGCLSATKDEDRQGLTMLANEVHRYDCKLSAELIHAGQWGALTLPEGEVAWVPSIVEPYHDPKRVREITRTEMLSVIDDFVAALRRCVDAHFDMAMIHYAHGNLMSGFLSTLWNQRGDKYGGSEKNRWRFPMELLEAAYDTVKGRIPLEMRIVGSEHMPGGTSFEERVRFVKEAQKYIDMIVVSAGTLLYGEAFSVNMPNYYIQPGVNVSYAAGFKEACPDLVVSVVGGISTLSHAEEIIKSGKADIVAMAKALMADTEFVNKGARGLEKEIRPCLRCMYCLRRNFLDLHIAGCAVNPTMGWEYRTTKPTIAPKKKKVMIVGGGPAAMAATGYLTERGHEVVLYEKSGKLGGRLFEASALSFKDGFRNYIEYAVRKTYESGARIELCKEATVDTILKESPDVLIIAIGAKPIMPAIKGIDLENVKEVSEVDRKDVQTGKRVVICGAGLSGTECALGLAMEGKEVILVDKIAESLFYKDVLDFNRASLTRLLDDYNVKLMPECDVQEFLPDGVILRKSDGEDITIECDTSVVAFGLSPDSERIEELNEVIPETYIIGDANKVGLVGDAIGEAYWLTKDI